jgi:hypothetical protein
MTKQEYKDYEERVARFFDKEGINNLSGDGEWQDFDHRPCECCKRPLGGQREHASGYNPATKEVQEYEICSDCLYYAEYGQLDDMTMMDMTD